MCVVDVDQKLTPISPSRVSWWKPDFIALWGCFENIDRRWQNKTRSKLTSTKVYVPNDIVPVPVLSNSWKATMNKASGAHRTDSKARNSWKEISLCGEKKKERKCGLNLDHVHLCKNQKSYDNNIISPTRWSDQRRKNSNYNDAG